MAGSRVSWAVGCVLMLSACGDDSAAAGGGTDSATGSTGGDATADGNSADDTGGPTAGDGDAGGCSENDDCVSDDPCMAGTCSEGMCSFEPALTGECRPAIDVEYPPRGATILGNVGEAVTITGTVTTGVGTIESLTLQGEPVDVQSDGSFSVDFDPVVGGNTLVFETVDSNEWTRKRVQSFLWSTEFMLPTNPMEGAAQQGLLMHLGQESLDDGDRSMPIDDLGSVFHLALDSLDLGSFIDPNDPVASQVGYDIYVTSLSKDSATVDLQARDGGLYLEASLVGIQGDLDFDCTNIGCELAGGDGTGGLSMSSVDISADILMLVGPDNALDVQLNNVTTNVNNLEIWSNNGWTDFLLGLIEGLIIDGLVSDVENLLSDEVENVLGPLLVDGLESFSLSAPIDFPSLSDSRGGITVQLETDVGESDWHDGVAPPDPSPTQSGLLGFRGGGYVATRATPYENLGIPWRAGCGTSETYIEMPRTAPLEVGLTDDLLNHLLYGAWAGGLLEFELDLGGDDEEGGGGLQIKDVLVTGMLAPTATDCNEDGTLLAHIGDLEITATITANGNETDFTAYTSMALEVVIDADEEGIVIAIPGVAWAETELTVVQDMSIMSEPGLAGILENTVESQLLDGLSGGFGGISLPEIDLSGLAGLPDGSATLAINVDSVERLPGATLLNAHF